MSLMSSLRGRPTRDARVASPELPARLRVRTRHRLLDGGYINQSGIIRQGQSVLRQQGHPWPEAVSEALDILSRRGFRHCPQELRRIDPCSVVLTYMPGRALQSPVPRWAASPETLRRVTRLVRNFSVAAEGIRKELSHSDWLIPEMSKGNVLVHGDPHPTNIVFNMRRHPTAIIDFELATLGTHEWNLLSMIFSWAPLEPINLTCWRRTPDLRIGERIKLMLANWPTPCTSDELAETGRAFITWRQTWIAELARLGNPGAIAFIEAANFHSRYQYAFDLIERSLR